MKDKDEIFGQVYINQKNFAFVFDNKTFKLEIFPDQLIDFISEMLTNQASGPKRTKRTWIPTIELDGQVFNGDCIRFIILDNPYYHDGIKEYSVLSFIRYSYGFDLNSIKGLRLSGDDIDIFYPAEFAVKRSVVKNNNELSASVETVNMPYLSCGKYRVAKGVDAELMVKAESKMAFYNPVFPMQTNSFILANYSVPVNLDVVLKTIENVRSFLQYACYRKNITFHKMEVCWEKDGRTQYQGIIGLKEEYVSESKSEKRNRLLRFGFFNKQTATIITQIKNNKMVFDYLCDSIDDTRHYPVSRSFGILSAFEREYRNIYGDNYTRSNQYTETKDTIVGLLKEQAVKLTGKRKRYVKHFINGIENDSLPFSNRVEIALCDCEEIISPFIEAFYPSRNKKEIYTSIAEHMGRLRNGIAHSRLDVSIKPVFMDDLKIMEIMIYAMRLKAIKKDSHDIITALSDLFGIRLVKSK